MRQLLSQLLNGYWAIDPQAAEAYLPVIEALITRTDLSEIDYEPVDKTQHEAYYLAETDGVFARLHDEEEDKRRKGLTMGVMPVIGVLTKFSSSSSTGMVDMQAMFMEMVNDPRINGILMPMDTPGGMVHGAASFADAIRDAGKPVIAVVNDGTLASAGFWLAAGATEIHSTHAHNLIGSIGAFAKLIDNTKELENAGIKIHTILADQSPDKGREVEAIIEDGDDKLFKKNLLNPIAAALLKDVRAGRGDRINSEDQDPLTGTMFNAKQALKMGLIDKITSFDNSVARLAVLARQHEKSNSTLKFK